MGLNTKAVFDELESLCLATGLFQKVNTHEPKRAPDGDLTAAIWVQSIQPWAAASGLAVTSALVTFNIRLYTNMLQEPPQAIDPTLMVATDTVMTDLTGKFTLGSDVGAVDLLGMAGATLNATGGYLDIDGTLFRVMDINVPCVIFDAWTQTA